MFKPLFKPVLAIVSISWPHQVRELSLTFGNGGLTIIYKQIWELLARCPLNFFSGVIRGTMQASSGPCYANSFCLLFSFSSIKINSLLEKMIFEVLL